MRHQRILSELESDGMLCDICGLNTEVSDWNRLLGLSSSLGNATYYCDGEEAPLPSTAGSIFEDDHVHLLRFDLGGVGISTQFFSVEEIELNLDPREITSEEDFKRVLDFCAKIGREIGRDIKIAPENRPQFAFLSYSAAQEKWEEPPLPNGSKS